MTHHVAIYGKGGVGTTSLASNISAALAEAGFKVMLVGCDPRGGSCDTLTSGAPLLTVFEALRGNGDITVDALAHRGFKGIACVELGDPSTSGICASSGFGRAFELFGRLALFETLAPDFVLYDVSGGSLCDGFFTPLAQHGDWRVFVATSADFMSLHAANTIFGALGRRAVPAQFGALIPSGLTSCFEETIIRDFATRTHTHTLGRIPRSLMVRQCELYGKTVIEASPLSNQSYFYRRLANQLVDEVRSPTGHGSPQPLSAQELREWAREWGDRIYALENGLVTDGAAI
jgi:nitrogenase iron protein NifH